MSFDAAFIFIHRLAQTRRRSMQTRQMKPEREARRNVFYRLWNDPVLFETDSKQRTKITRDGQTQESVILTRLAIPAGKINRPA
jgi:hypothetical protein